MNEHEIHFDRPKGVIYFDKSSRGGKRFHNCWRAEILLAGVRLRRRSKDKEELELWLNTVRRIFVQYLATRKYLRNRKDLRQALKELRPMIQKL